MPPPEFHSLRDFLSPHLQGRTISDRRGVISLTEILAETSLNDRLGELSGRSVLLAVKDQLISGIAMTEIDGIARRMLLVPRDLDVDQIPTLIADAEIDAVVTDEPARWAEAGIAGSAGIKTIIAAHRPAHAAGVARTLCATEWLMLTSGTTGAPKIVSHTLGGLTGAIMADGPVRNPAPTWATFYDIRRYGGLQIFLRAVLGGGSMVLSEPGEPLAEHLARLHAGGVTHISGTPSHWRKVLMSASIAPFSPHYVRLSGEIADQTVLDNLRKAFPTASIGHAYASTEAGVGFAVNDGFEGFPAALVGPSRDGVELDVKDGSLRIRSTRTAVAYVGQNPPALGDPDGFIDTGDMVERRGDRYHFVGRRGGIINVGGLKVHPEEIEAVINRHSLVRMSRAKSRRSPVTGAIVAADVVLSDPCDAGSIDQIRGEILADCKSSLAPYKIPAVIHFVASLDVTAAGKLDRHNA
jgi:acyl-CoA synthetase (AMP-forming)/AMP-acid ligase II